MQKIKFVVAIKGFNREEMDRRMKMMNSILANDFIIDTHVLGGSVFLDSAQDFKNTGVEIAKGMADLSPDSCDVAILAGAIDPGLLDARRVAKVPVIGPGEVGMLLANLLGKRISIVTVDKYAVDVSSELVKRHRMEQKVISIKSMDLPVRQIVQDLDKAREVLSEQCRKAVHEDGADVIYLGSMSLGTLGVTENLKHELRVPIIDPNLASLRFAELACNFLPSSEPKSH